MRELLSKRSLEYQDRAREVAEKYARPQAAELDRTGDFCWEVIKQLQRYELFGIWIPKEYGGQGSGVLDMCLVVEQLSRACGGVGVAYAVNALGSFPIIQIRPGWATTHAWKIAGLSMVSVSSW